jgi:predicted ester cyclase
MTVFTDYEFKVEAIIAEGDDVAVRGVFTGTHSRVFMDRPATGKRVSVA